MNRSQANPIQTPAPAPFTIAGGALLQRQCACGQHTGGGGECAGCKKKRLGLQRAAVNPAAPDVAPPIVHEVLRSPGRPLDEGTRAAMASRYGQDFSRVRVHTDAKAGRSAQAVNALAYTVGQDVVFGAGQYAVHTQPGRRLLAHELAHVVQQGEGSPGALRIAPSTSPFEAQAEAAARDLSGSALSIPPNSSPPAIYRDDGRPETGGSSQVHRIVLSCGDTVDFETNQGPFSYALEPGCKMPPGEYEPVVTVTGNDVGFDFSMYESETPGAFDFKYRIDPGQPNPSTLFNRSGDTVSFAVLPPAGETTVNLQVRLLTLDEFQALSGVDPSTLPEGQLQIVSPAGPAAGLTVSPEEPGLVAPSLGLAGVQAISPMSLVPANSTGVLLGPGHVSFFATPNGSPTFRGFRASLFTHAMADLGPGAIGESFSTRLWSGAQGGFRQDWIFSQMAPQTVLYLPRDGEAAAAFAEHLRSQTYSQEYRYSPPSPSAPPGSPEARARTRIYGPSPSPEAILCTQNCVTVPAAEWEMAIKQRPTLETPRGTLDILTGQMEGGETDPYRRGRFRDVVEYSRQPQAQAGGVQVRSFTPAGGQAFRVVKVGGTIMLIYGIFQTEERLRATYGTPQFGEVAAEEAGTWAGGILGSALGTAAAGAIICSPTGPIDLVCVAGGFVLGALGGMLFGTAGGMAGRAIYRQGTAPRGPQPVSGGVISLGQGLYMDENTKKVWLGPGPKF